MLTILTGAAVDKEVEQDVYHGGSLVLSPALQVCISVSNPRGASDASVNVWFFLVL